MIRVAIYARYSDDAQSSASIEDQFRICREYSLREGWTVITTYHDAAISGATVILRPGIKALLRDAQSGKYDIVLAESLDRISRSLADTATLFEHLRFVKVQIVTVADGKNTAIHIGLKGTMNSIYLTDLAAKTHRGLRGRIERGKSAGGLCFGYDVVRKSGSDGLPLCGERKINEDQALVVARIFQEFASGKSPNAIATSLNEDGIPGPNGGRWLDTTIRGHRARGTGIINNELYSGSLVWNRQTYVKNPSTGKRVSRPNEPSSCNRVAVPELAIVSNDLWQAVRNRQSEIAKVFEATSIGIREARAKVMHSGRRSVSLLSGLLKCGCCNGKLGLILRNRFGCLNKFRKLGCQNGRTVRRDDIENRVLQGLIKHLASPGAIAEAVEAYQLENVQLNRERSAQSHAHRRKLETIEKSIGGILRAIEDGMYQPSMKLRMDELECQKAELLALMMNTPPSLPEMVPDISTLYRANVARLAETLNECDDNRDAIEAIRLLVGEVVVTPGAKRGEIHAMLRGELTEILNLATTNATTIRSTMTNAVAGPRNQRYLRSRRDRYGPRKGVSTAVEFHCGFLRLLAIFQ